MLQRIRRLLFDSSPPVVEPIEGYGLWAKTYDDQPDNVVFHIEGRIFDELLSRAWFKGKRVLDIGCGTGRHWPKLLRTRPKGLIGADTSAEMLNGLREKLGRMDPMEVKLALHHIRGAIEVDGAVDAIVSTLAMNHIAQLDGAIAEWSKLLVTRGELIITEFHPAAGKMGMKRTFWHEGQREIINHQHSIDELLSIFCKNDLALTHMTEGVIDSSVRALFDRQNYSSAYDRYRGTPLVIGFHLTKRR